MGKLSEAKVAKRLSSMIGWTFSEGEITKKFSFKPLMNSINFVNKVAKSAEAANHHSDNVIKYNTVKIKLATHSDGGVTEKDFALASKIEKPCNSTTKPLGLSSG